MCSAAALTLALFSSVEGVYSLPSPWVIHVEEPEFLPTAAVCLSVWLQFGLSSCGKETKGSETMQQITKLRGKISIS